MLESRAKSVIQTLTVAALYAISGQLGFMLAINPGNVTAVWPSSGVALAAILLRGTPSWLGIWLGAFAVNMIFYTKLSTFSLPGFASSIAIASGSTIQALTAGYFLRKSIKNQALFERPQDAFSFILISAACCLIAASIGVSGLCLAGFLPWTGFAYTWLTWWAGDTAGLLVYTPLILTWHKLPSFTKDPKRLVEFASFLSLLTAACYVIFGNSYIGQHHFPLLFCVFPFLVWAAGRFGIGGVTIALPLVEIFAILGIKNGTGPLVLKNLNESLLLMAVFMANMLLIGLTFSIVLSQWQKLRARLENTAHELETKVQERTVELQEANSNLLVARDQAIEASNIKSAFVANISHELRTPLSGIVGMAEILRADQQDSKTHGMVETLYESAQALLAIVNDMLDLSKIEAGRMTIVHEPFNPTFLVQDCTKLLSTSAIGKKLKLNLSLDTEIPQFVYGDAPRVRQAILNLIGNAIKFTEQGNVMVSVNLETQDTETATIKFLVKDTGIGIEKDKQKMLFAPFSQVDNTNTRRFGGTGLGLAISKRLIEIMGGTVGFESEIHVGSTFWFSIPFAKMQAEQKNETGKSEAQKPVIEPMAAELALNKNILVVEDSPLLRKITSTQLSMLGLHCEMVEHGKNAVDEFKTGRYDLILMDIHLPDMNGYQATALIRALEMESGGKAEQRIPIIAITAGAMDGDREAALNAGLDDYLAKPVNIEDLRATLTRWLGRKRTAHLNLD